jgi:hypothetical protein
MVGSRDVESTADSHFHYLHYLQDAILDQVMCANCRVLVTDATTSLEQG